jgi:transposase InsO family protein
MPMVPAAAGKISSQDLDRFLQKDKDRVDLAAQLPDYLQDFQDVFQSRQTGLPPRRPGVDHAIKLRDANIELPTRRPYPMSPKELQAVKAYIDDQLQKGNIRPSTSPVASPVILVRKPQGGIRVCVDYRALNELTEKDRYAPPEIRETLAQLSKARIFTKLDVVAAFNQIRIREGDEKLTTFATRFGNFEYLVMPFGLCNAPATFQRYINSALHDCLDQFASAYVDDVLVYSEDPAQHQDHVRRVLTKLREAALPVDIEKSAFGTPSVEYLGMVISSEGVKKDPKKVEAIREWLRPKSIKDVQAFVGFTSFYRRFIPRYSALAKPLTDLIRVRQPPSSKSDTAKGPAKRKRVMYEPFQWTPEAEKAFLRLKTEFAEDVLLTHYDPDREIIVETDASDFVTAGVLSQPHDGILRPIAFFSRKMSPAEINYEVYDKEMLAIINAFENWRPELVGTEQPVKVLSDHKNLEYFMTTKRLNRRQARWAELLADYNFRIQYRPGKENIPADTLSRGPDSIPSSRADVRIRVMDQTLLPPIRLASNQPALAPDDPKAPAHNHLEDYDLTALQSLYQTHPDLLCLRQAIDRGDRSLPTELRRKGWNISAMNLHWDSDLRVMISTVDGSRKIVFPRECPELTAAIAQCHGPPTVGHLGRDSTFEKISRWVWAPALIQSVKRFVQACQACQRQYAPSAPALLRPLPVADGPWTSVSLDFKGPLPTCIRQGRPYRFILTIVDRFTKRKHFVPMSRITASMTADAFITHIWKLHGLPNEIISDRGRQFDNELWNQMMARLGVERKLSSAFHPQSNGQAESANKQIQRYLAFYVNEQQDNWVDLLPLAEFCINDTLSSSLGMTPFEADLGRRPRNLPDLEPGRRDFMQHHAKLNEKLRARLLWIRARQKDIADQTRTPPKRIEQGDFVWLSTKNIKLAYPSQKLAPRWIGPVRVASVIDEGKAYRLELPDHLSRIHNAFHPDLLRLDSADPLPGQITEVQPAVEASDPTPSQETTPRQAEFEVEDILDSRRKKKRIEYRVRWAGEFEPSWQPVSNLKNCRDLIADFHHAYPMKPKPAKFAPPEDWSPFEGRDQFDELPVATLLPMATLIHEAADHSLGRGNCCGCCGGHGGAARRNPNT